MSAFLVSQDLLNLIVNTGPCEPEEATFQLLLNENLRSLQHRYPGRCQDEEALANSYRFERIAPVELIERTYRSLDERIRAGYAATKHELTIERARAQVVAACDCYDYQSCETDDYYSTPAALLVNAVRNDFPPPPKNLISEAVWGF